MAAHVLTNCNCWLHGYDLTGDMNAMALDYGAELQDNTVFGDATRSRAGGLKTFGFNHQGYWNGGNGEVDDVLFDNLAVLSRPMTVCPENATEGSVAYTFRPLVAQYQFGGQVGDMLAFSVSGEPQTGPLVRATIMQNGSEAATADGTARQLGAVASGESMYGALHVFSGTGTLDVVVESDATNSFAGAETTRITFTQASGVTSEWSSVAGAITDTWWRVTFTIATGPFNFAVVLGVK